MTPRRDYRCGQASRSTISGTRGRHQARTCALYRAVQPGITLDKLAGVGELTLRRGVDFDHVVMGISLVIPYLCQELINDPRQNGSWANMVKNVQTTRTQALQMWFGATAATLGWVASEPAVMDADDDPLNSWADMS